MSQPTWQPPPLNPFSYQPPTPPKPTCVSCHFLHELFTPCIHRDRVRQIVVNTKRFHISGKVPVKQPYVLKGVNLTTGLSALEWEIYSDSSDLRWTFTLGHTFSNTNQVVTSDLTPNLHRSREDFKSFHPTSGRMGIVSRYPSIRNSTGRGYDQDNQKREELDVEIQSLKKTLDLGIHSQQRQNVAKTCTVSEYIDEVQKRQHGYTIDGQKKCVNVQKYAGARSTYLCCIIVVVLRQWRWV